MNLQSIFNKSACHLLFQGKRSFQADKNSEFAYIGSNGRMDGIGCLIKNHYSIEMEGLGVQFLCIEFKKEMEKSLAELNSNKIKLLVNIQSLHDNYPVNEWKTRFLELAYKYNLDSRVLKDF